MVAHLLRLKLTLLRNSLRRRPSQLIGLAFGVLYGGGAVATVLVKEGQAVEAGQGMLRLT